ncbi:hypothetical protein FRC09_005724 [Ceratobasidium sp. 395]|nr:hypothetical protein FRC09_005724 [Ceratobasidium sp. 395]
MSRKSKSSGSSSQPAMVRTSIYDADSRGRVRSGNKRQKKSVQSSTMIPVRGDIREALSNRSTEHTPATVPVAETEDSDWVDEELDDPPATTSGPSKNTPNRQLRDWQEQFADIYLPILYARDAAPTSTICFGCSAPCSTFYQCRTCLSAHARCQQCTVSSHNNSPTHYIRRWNAEQTCWEADSLANLGCVLKLGHAGADCPKHGSDVSILVGDLHGLAEVKVRFCDCAGHATRSSQLLAAGLMACSDHLPQSAFTVNMLDHLSVFTTAGKCSVYKYWTVLKRFTNPGFPGKVSDRYRELLQTLRKYNYMIHRKRSGVAFQQHILEADSTDQGLPCVACPRPTYNFNQCEVAKAEEELFRFWVSFDGNFRNPRKAKPVDPDDVCLTDGRFYFPPQHLYKKYLASLDIQKRRPEDTKSDCSNHKAAKNQFVKFLGTDISGLGAATCSRHSIFLPRGVVDFIDGERYAYGDCAVASCFRYATREGQLKLGVTYDIFCQWFKKLKERAKSLPADISFPEWLDIIGGVPKFHLVGHKQSCKDRLSLNWMRWVGMIEGEGCERAWAYLNETAGSTSEMSPGFRRDSICYIMADWNFGKMIAMASKFKEALKMYKLQHEKFLEIDESVPATKKEGWHDLSLEAKELKKGVWISPLSTPSSSGKLQELARFNQNAESSSAHTLAKKPGVTQWIITGIDIESEKYRLRQEKKCLKESATLRQRQNFDDKRKALNERILLFREGRDKYMGQCEDPDHPDCKSGNSADPETAELGLPSSYSAATLLQLGLKQLAELEADLRRADCNDTLDRVRDLLGARSLTLKSKQKNVRGEIGSTRAETALRKHTDKIHTERWRYNDSRSALIRLGASPGDLKIYQFLAETDLKYLKEWSEVTSCGLGQSRKTISWIWTGRSDIFEDEDSWLAQTMKVEWFRARERYRRWEEELQLVKREMVMSYRSFKTHENIWKFKAESSAAVSPPVPGMAEYAHARSAFFRRLAEDVLHICTPYIQDKTVPMKWCEDWLLAHEQSCMQTEYQQDVVQSQISRVWPTSAIFDQSKLLAQHVLAAFSHLDVHRSSKQSPDGQYRDVMLNPWDGLEESLFGMSAAEVRQADRMARHALLSVAAATQGAAAGEIGGDKASNTNAKHTTAQQPGKGVGGKQKGIQENVHSQNNKASNQLADVTAPKVLSSRGKVLPKNNDTHPSNRSSAELKTPPGPRWPRSAAEAGSSSSGSTSGVSRGNNTSQSGTRLVRSNLNPFKQGTSPRSPSKRVIDSVMMDSPNKKPRKSIKSSV